MTVSTETPLFTVVKGSPTDDEVAALTAVFTQLIAAAAPAEDKERNLWGRPVDRLQRHTVYNPSAFRSVTFY